MAQEAAGTLEVSLRYAQNTPHSGEGALTLAVLAFLDGKFTNSVREKAGGVRCSASPGVTQRVSFIVIITGKLHPPPPASAWCELRVTSHFKHP